ncbi:uncharacterized protein Pyn_08770 [Prunus yedoensis var. nudiflora]|uniref:Uncharacterized protein n=1 Tax=Prunus yedoensis var. nudiflora TaxID=2094558 RepID=A0A314Z701_PRUYE|nr:uncharacterized protein Pyn_08770 [Prunus yedoensis var. nudiflora]
MSGSKVLLTYKRKRQSRTDPVQGHECRNSLFVAPDDTSLSKPPDLQVHLIDKRSSEHYNRNSAVCHVCFVCCVGGNLKHCGKCLQSYHLQCLDKPHKEKNTLNYLAQDKYQLKPFRQVLMSLMHEEEQLHDEEKTGSDALQQVGEVLGQCAQSAMDVEVLCMDHLRKSNETRDSSSEAATLCKPGKTHALIRDEGQVLSSAYLKATETPHLGRSLPYLDLSVIPTDSCGTVEYNVDFKLEFSEAT